LETKTMKAKRIPFSRPYPIESSALVEGFSKIVDTRWYTKGENVRSFEETMGSYLDVDHAIATGTGSAALVIGLHAYANRVGADSITMPAFTFEAVRYTIEFAGIKKIEYGDVDSETWTLRDADYSTPLVMGMDTFGNRCDLKNTEPERLIFDAAQSFGAEIRRDRGALEIISFAGSKVLTTGGEGGMITTNDKALADECKHLRELFSKMPESCALVGLAMMEHIDEILERKAEIADHYRRSIPLRFQEITSTNNYIVACLMENRDAFIKEHRDKADFRDFYREPLASAPVTDTLAEKMLCLPNGPDVLPDIDYVCDLVSSWIK
jgi:dTDP-4-amino-4,6-dideoxygalactose transaminase